MNKYLLLIFSILFLIVEVNCKKNPVTPPLTLSDTTSHNFIVTRIDTLGGWFSSAYGVDIVDRDNIWVTGEFTVLHPPIEYRLTHNLAHWNGDTWEMIVVPIMGYNNTGPSPEQLGGIKVFNDSSIYVTTKFDNSSAWFDGSHWFSAYEYEAIVSQRFWARSSHEMYFVGPVGALGNSSIYEGQTLKNMPSGQLNLPLVDVWGDEKMAYTLGSSNDMQSNAILYSDNRSSWTIANSYSISDKTLPPPHQYMGRLISIFRTNAQSKLWVLGGEDHGWLYEITSLLPFSATIFYKIPTTIYPEFVRGNADNDLFLFGAYGDIWHYNGSTWKLITTIINFHMLSCAVKGNTVTLVGDIYVDPIIHKGGVITLQRQ